MKLLYCDLCGDIFNLKYELKSCSCGRVMGRYTDPVYAETNGEGISVAIGNGSFQRAILNMLQAGRYAQDVREDNSPTSVLCWVRWNDGPSNPHSSINKEMKHEEA